VAKQQPSEAYALEEQARADALALRIEELNTEPDRWSVDQYQHAARAAFETAAAHTAQPGGSL
jgi:hypothetical protein